MGGAIMKSVWIATVAFTVLGLPAQGLADLRSDLAKRYQAEPEFYVMNLPPKPGGWPGSIYDGRMRFALVRAEQKDNPAAAGPAFEMSVEIKLDASASAGVSLLPLFGVSAEASHAAVAFLNIQKAQIFEMTLPQLRDRIKALPTQDQRPPGPVIVHRAYVGVPSLTLGRKNGADAEAWAKLKSGLVDANARASAAADEKIVIALQEPIVFAYEIARVSDLPKFSLAPDVYPTSSLVLSKFVASNGLPSIQISSAENGKVPDSLRATSSASHNELIQYNALSASNNFSKNVIEDILKADTKVFEAVDKSDTTERSKKFILMVQNVNFEKTGLIRVRAIDFEKANICFTDPNKC